MAIETVPEWMLNLEIEDVALIKKFVLASGSLKEIAKQYQVTYPTVRLRLDKLIEKIQMSQNTNSEPYIALIQELTISEKVDCDTAKLLISAYKNAQKEGR